MKIVVIICLAFLIFSSCKNQPKQLPFLGNPTINGLDTNYPIIAPFSFIDQDSVTITNETFKNKIYVADFIFLSCPSICPKMNHEMFEVYMAFSTDDRVAFLSHSIDPERDTVAKLKSYAENLGVRSSKWHFVTGRIDNIYDIANKSYFATAYRDSTAPGGFTHSGGFLLVDKQKHIRGVYNGTDPRETKRLISDIQILLKSEF